ncbi:hypothetical protein EYF80_056554 [Liparis tanakae]|uniref:Uncharacterized protein n=1 Tax=Liparis tanakae TaxID=230148 RepID=A0A4Z2EWX6_9TELE|nr:hypothetical protein EYF80_056554 [Liparis tanakae]
MKSNLNFRDLNTTRDEEASSGRTGPTGLSRVRARSDVHAKWVVVVTLYQLTDRYRTPGFPSAVHGRTWSAPHSARTSCRAWTSCRAAPEESLALIKHPIITSFNL